MKSRLFLLAGIILLSSTVLANSAIVPSGKGTSTILRNNTSSASIILQSNNSSSLLSSPQQNSQNISQKINKLEDEFLSDSDNANKAIHLIELYLDEENTSKYKCRSVATTLYILSKTNSYENYSDTQKRYFEQLDGKISLTNETAPNNPHNLALMSGMAALSGNREKALEYANRAKSINPHLYTLLPGVLYYLNHDFKTATQLLEEALSYNSRDIDVYFYLLQAQAGAGDNIGAIKTAKYLLPYKRFRYQATIPLYFSASEALNKGDRDFTENVAGILHKNPADKGQIYTELACIYIKRHNTEFSNEFITRAIQFNPEDTNTYLNIAEAFVTVHESEKAKKMLEMVQNKIEKKDDISKYNLISSQINGNKIVGAKELMNSGLYEDAIKAYSASANPDSLDSLLGIATCLQYLGHKEKALIYYNKAMSMYPDNADVYYAMAFYFSNNNDIETAKKYLNNALRLNPKHKDALKLANHLLKQKEEDLMEVAFYHFDSKNYNEAIETLNKIISVNPSNVAAYYYKGLTYISMENYPAAISEFLKVTKQAPEFYLVYYSLGIAYDNINESAEAVRYYKKFISIAAPQTEEEQSYFNYAKSRIEKLSGK